MTKTAKFAVAEATEFVEVRAMLKEMGCEAPVGFVSEPSGKKIKYRDSDRFQKATISNKNRIAGEAITVFDDGEEPEDLREWGVTLPEENRAYQNVLLPDLPVRERRVGLLLGIIRQIP